MRILFFSVSIGAGHDSAAKSIMGEVTRKYPDSKVLMVDTFDYINPTLNKVIVGSYMETLKFNPKIWGKLYEQAEEGEQFVDLRQLLNKLLSNKLEKLIKEFAPDAIVCTHAFPAGIISVLKSKGKLKVPLVAVFTDYIVHSFWIHENIDAYIIPTEDLKHLIISHGIDERKLKAYGIPVRQEFSSLPSKEQARVKVGIDDKLTFLVMGGGLGLGDVEEIIKELGNSDLDCNIIAVAGKNEKLRRNLEMLDTKIKPKVFGYTEEVPLLMAASDIIVTKPGGLTTAEVLSAGIPMIIVSPLPGQEERNTEFLLNSGVALKVRKVGNLNPVINQLTSNPLRMKHIKEMCRVIGRPRASNDIVDYLGELIGFI